MKYALLATLAIAAVVLSGCGNETTPADPAVYDATPYAFDPQGLPRPPLPTDYPLTNARVQLGRLLFYDGRLSRTGNQSCATCHTQTSGFSDLRKFSIGVRGLPGTRQAMMIANLAWHRRGFFWDGRSPTLRDQALHPIQDPLEMDNTLQAAVATIQALPEYRAQFIRAFNTDTVTAERIGVALEQFMLSIVSGNSKWDRVQRGTDVFTPEEERGRRLFFTEFDPTGKVRSGECFHCHGGPNFTNDRYMNNGLDNDASFTDLGREKVTGLASDRAKFKVPSLRNIAVTPPYMHDGRFSTLEDVVIHYARGVQRSSTADPLLQYNFDPGLNLTGEDVQDLVAFLRTLTDSAYLFDSRYSRP